MGRKTPIILLLALVLSLCLGITAAWASSEPEASAIRWRDAVAAARDWDALTVGDPEGVQVVTLTAENVYIATVRSGCGVRALSGADLVLRDACLDTAETAILMDGGSTELRSVYINAGAAAAELRAGGGIDAADCLFRVRDTAFVLGSGSLLRLQGCHIRFDGSAGADPDLAAAYGVDLTDPIFAGDAAEEVSDAQDTGCLLLLGSAGDAAGGIARVELTDCELQGDILSRTADTLLSVSLTDSALTGAIVPEESGELSLTLRSTRWTVTDTSRLTRLSIDETSEITGVLTVNGRATEILPGEYEGELLLSPPFRPIGTLDVSGEIYLNLEDLRDSLGM